jgi:hypothetical protein
VGRSAELTFTRDGYLSETRTVAPVEDTALVVDLTPAPERASPAPPTPVIEAPQ